MELTRECNDLPRQGAKRRSSLFMPQGKNLSSCYRYCDTKYAYPKQYQKKLKLELEEWDKEDEKFNSIISKKESRLELHPSRNDDILSVKQQDFLSSLTDYDTYHKCVSEFNNRFAIVVEKLSAENEKLLNHHKHVKDANKEVLNLCKTEF